MPNVTVSLIFDEKRDTIPGMSGERAVNIRDVAQAKALFGMSSFIDELFLDYELSDGHNTFEAVPYLSGVRLNRVIFHSTTHPELLPVLQWELEVLGFTGQVLTYGEFLRLPKLEFN